MTPAESTGAQEMTPTGRRRGRPPKQDAGDTKEELLQAALALFAAKGYEGTSVRDIARAVGLSEGGLYAHFDGKRAIFDAALARLGPPSAVQVLDGLDVDPDTDPPRFLRLLVTRVMAEWSAPPSRQLISLMSHDDMIHEPALLAGILASLGILTQLFGRWIEAGRIAADAGSPDDLAYALMAPVALARVLWLHNGARPEEIEAARQRADRHAELFVRVAFRS
jgi:AcrR family transcriptional regulator